METSKRVIDDSVIEQLIKLDSEIPAIPNKVFAYGTAGFRYPAKLLDKVIFRSAIMACLYSMDNEALPTGIMLTASHNLHVDNGIKIAGIKGEKISEEMERNFVQIANSSDLKSTLIGIIDKLKLKTDKCFMLLGNDTRESNENFVKIITKVFGCFKNCKYKHYQVITTPCLHFLTYFSQINFNKNKTQFEFPDESNYWKFLKMSYEEYVEFYNKHFKTEKRKIENDFEFTIDCSNGTAAFCKDKIMDLFSNKKNMKVSCINTDYKNFNLLNEGCGAEFVHKQRQFPSNLNKAVRANVSFDGDVDRIIYFLNIKDKMRLIDGDRLIVLNSLMLNHFISLLSPNLKEKFLKEIKVGIVTTAYANGALISYCKTNFPNLELVLAKTGVKYLQTKSENYDMAVFFEANGHGTIHIAPNIEEKINKLQSEVASSKDSQVLELLIKYVTMFNVTVGDALSCLITTDAALLTLNMSFEDLAEIFQEIPSLQIKVQVKDKNIFVCNEDESRLIQPEVAQKFIDDAVNGVEEGRCFVRPSGTEDVVRVYVEAKKKEDVDTIIEKVKGYLTSTY